MSLDWHPCELSQRVVLAIDLAVQDPAIATDGAEVLVRDPPVALVGMSPFCPLPEHLEERVIHVAEGLLAHDVPVVVGPAPQEWVEQQYQFSGRHLRIGLHRLPNLCQEGLDVLLGRRDDVSPAWLGSGHGRNLSPCGALLYTLGVRIATRTPTAHDQAPQRRAAFRPQLFGGSPVCPLGLAWGLRMDDCVPQ